MSIWYTRAFEIYLKGVLRLIGDWVVRKFALCFEGLLRVPSRKTHFQVFLNTRLSGECLGQSEEKFCGVSGT